jgi:hypothetical protein
MGEIIERIYWEAWRWTFREMVDDGEEEVTQTVFMENFRIFLKCELYFFDLQYSRGEGNMAILSANISIIRKELRLIPPAY